MKILIFFAQSILCTFCVYSAQAQDTRPTSIQWLRPLKYDFNINGEIDFPDFVDFVNHFGTTRGNVRYHPQYDLIGNGTVDFIDFLRFVEHFGKTQTVVEAHLLPILDTPGGLLVKFSFRDIIFGFTNGSEITRSTIGDTISISVQTNKEGEVFETQLIGIDGIGDQVTGANISMTMPIFYANVLIQNITPNSEGRRFFDLNIPAMPDTLWAYVETDDRDDLEFTLIDGATFIAGRTIGVQDKNGQRRLYKYNRTSRLSAGNHSIGFIERIGKSYRVIFTDFSGFLFDK